MNNVSSLRKSFTSLGLVLATLQTTLLAEVTPSAYEGFAYTAGQPLDGQTGGSGFGGSWNLTFEHGKVAKEIQPAIIAASLEYPGLRTTGGACRVYRSDNALVHTRREISAGFSSEANEQTRYLAFLVKPEGVLAQGALNGYFVVGLEESQGGIFAGKPGADRPDRYVLEQQGGFGQVASGVAPVIDQTALLVIKMELREGLDKITLYVNPPVGPLEPRQGVVKSDCDLGIPRNLILYSTGAHTIDEIRFGKTFAEVVPPAASKK